MINPKEKLREYLNILIHRFLHSKSLYQELAHISAWQISKIGRDTINLSGPFFQMVNYCMIRIYIVEFASVFSKNEDRSLFDWLNKAYEHAKVLEPSMYFPSDTNDRKAIKPREYQTIIQNQISQLESHSDEINKIKSLRDKLIAHFDKPYFENPGLALENYPVTPSEIGELIETASKIMKKHYSYLFNADLRIETIVSGNVDHVLFSALAFQQIRKDQDLIKSGFKPSKYEVSPFIKD